MPSSRYIFASLPWYSVLVVSGICAAILWAMHEEKRMGLPKDTVVDLALWLIPCGVIGARLYYVAFAWDTFAAHPWSIFAIWNGGLAIYGGIIGGALAAFVFSRRRKIALLRLLDMVAPGVLLAQAIGRWGNFFNMEAYGLEVTNEALQFFPFAVLIPENGTYVWHMATFFYESMWNLLGFIAIACTRKKMRRSGDILFWYLLIYGGGRLIVEGLRLDSLMTTGGNARVSQLLSVCLCLLVCGLYAWRAVGRKKKCQAWISGALAGLCMLVACLLLPHPHEAFLGYEVVWMVIACGSALASVMLAMDGGLSVKQRIVSLLPLLPVIFSLLARRALALFAVAAWKNDLLLCILLTVTLLADGCCFYPIANRRCLCQQDG